MKINFTIPVGKIIGAATIGIGGCTSFVVTKALQSVDNKFISFIGATGATMMINTYFAEKAVECFMDDSLDIHIGGEKSDECHLSHKQCAKGIERSFIARDLWKLIVEEAKLVNENSECIGTNKAFFKVFNGHIEEFNHIMHKLEKKVKKYAGLYVDIDRSSINDIIDRTHSIEEYIQVAHEFFDKELDIINDVNTTGENIENCFDDDDRNYMSEEMTDELTEF